MFGSPQAPGASSSTRPSAFLARLRSAGAALGLALTLTASALAANFTPGNLVVVRVGDGSIPLTNAAAPVFLEEYTPAGVLVQTIPLPTSTVGANSLFTNSGSATSEAFLDLTTNGQYLICGGYGAAVGTISVAGSASINAPRVIARIDMTGAVDTSTALTDAHSGGNIRSVASDDGLQYWTAGSNEGVRYATHGSTTSTMISTGAPTNVRVVNIAGGQLYVSANSGAFRGIASVGTGLPTTAGQPILLLPGFPMVVGPSTYDYFFADANTVYVADDASLANGGGIQKWTLSGGTWTHQYTFNNGTNGCRGVTGFVNAGVTTLYATTSAFTLNEVITVTDTGPASVVSPVTAAALDTALRGVRLIAGGTSPTGTPFCAGDGTGTACPCGNHSPVGNNEGCLSSLAVGGRLIASGSPSLSGDTVVLSGSQMPNSSALYFQGTAQQAGGAGAPFGDGLRCASGSIVRLGTKTNAAGSSQYPAAGDAPVSVKGLVGAPGVRTYQSWYRNAAAFCTASTFNLTNGLEVVWSP